MHDPLKQGLKHSFDVAVPTNKSAVKVHDPLKQGLKLKHFLHFIIGYKVKVHDPLKLDNKSQ